MIGTEQVYRLAPIPSISVQVPLVYPSHSVLEPILFLQALSSILLALAFYTFRFIMAVHL
jgi:hypothetical protein